MIQAAPDQTIYSQASKAIFCAPAPGVRRLLVRFTETLPIYQRLPTAGADDEAEEEPRPSQRARFQDLADRILETTPILDGALIGKVEQALHSGELVVVQGRFVPYGKQREDGAPLCFELQGVSRLTRPSDLCGASAVQIAAADQLIDELLAQGGEALFQYIVDRAFQLLGLVPSHNPRFHDLVRLVVLQALSEGMFEEGTNPRLHILLNGMPGAGKKCFTRLAGLLAPVHMVVQPVLLTPPGLTATVTIKEGGGYCAKPGVMPKCSGGTCIVEDSHKVQPSHKKAVQGVLMATMEDGQVSTAKAAAVLYSARCALLINCNLLSQTLNMLPPQGAAARLADMSITSEILSRADIVMMFDQGDDPAGTSKRIVVRDAVVARDEAERDAHDGEVAALRLLVARLRDRLPEVDMMPVAQEAYRLIDDLAVVLRHQCAGSGGALDGDMLLRRMANSVRKLVAAEARLHGRSEARPEDVARAWSLLKYKLEAVGWLCGTSVLTQPLPERQELVSAAWEGVEVQFLRLLKEFGGQVVTLEQAAARLGLGPRVVGRELWRRGLVPKGGTFYIPSLESYRAAQLQRIIDEEEAPVVVAAAPEAEEAAAPVVEEVFEVESVPGEVFAAPKQALEPEIAETLAALRAPAPAAPLLPQVPRRYHEALDALGRLPEELGDRAMRTLCRPLDAEYPLELLDQEQQQLLGMLRDLGLPERVPRDEFRGWLMAEDAEERALRGLAVYAESMIVGDHDYDLIRHWGRETRPRIKRAIEALVDLMDRGMGRPLRDWSCGDWNAIAAGLAVVKPEE